MTWAVCKREYMTDRDAREEITWCLGLCLKSPKRYIWIQESDNKGTKERSGN